MAEITAQLRIDAPADRVWEVIGPGFARIGEWASVIPASTPAPAPATTPGPAAGLPVDAATAPVTGRVCTTGGRLIPQVTELLVAYDPEGRTLTYQASSGLPAFVTLARNTWTVIPDGESACLVTLDAQFQARGAAGLLARWVIAIQSRRNARLLQADLRHYLSHGTPSPRKQRQLTRLQCS